jgi:hypothetical protein
LSGRIPNPLFWENPNPFKIKNEGAAHMEKSTPNRKRNILLRVFVTESERDFIYEKMTAINTNNFGAYARKMLIDGYAINTDVTDLKTVAAEIQKIGVNINQIARRVNITSRIYEQDFNELSGKVEEIWQLLRLSLSRAR